MKKAFLLLLIIFLAFPFSAYSAKTFVIQETEKIGLVPNATDPDSDKLVTYYSYPLNENGEWQTAYGDAGTYETTITVSDGTKNVSTEAIIIVKKKEIAPAIDSFEPKEEKVKINEAESINFSASASDMNEDKLSYQWLADGKKAKDGSEFTYETNYKDAGIHNITAIVSDGNMTASKEWNVNVANVDVEGVLNSIQDADANENDAVKLNLPDFEKYGLAYTISEPIGNKNEWKTAYGDAGNYDAKVHAEGNGFNGNKIVKVVVHKVDRAPVFEQIQNIVINENEYANITLKAYDPDGDDVAFTASSIPQGASIAGNIFSWKPDYDVVRKEDFIDKVVDKFTVLSKSFYVQFAASSKDKKVVQNIIITVKDANRAPVIDDIKPITINEGETLKIIPNAYDPDNDKVSVKYSGFANSNMYTSKFGDAGNHFIKVAASDGLLETSRDVQINIQHVNRAPVFEKIKNIKASEGEQIAVLLNANDPDGDEVNYSIDNPPEGSSLKGNTFLWAPGYNFSNKGETKKMDLVFAASDGKLQTKQIARAEISDKNRAPRIINASGNVVANVNKPVLMYVKAADDDGDNLIYTWRFSFFERYRATPNHQRIFRTRGTKTVKVIVSDGTDKVEQIINVNVI